MQEPSEPTILAWARLVRAQRALVTRIEADLKAAGLPPLSWYDVLWALRRAPGRKLTPGDLEGEMLLEQYNLSRLLDRMEADGLVRRVPYPGDRRRQLVQLTPAGRAMQKRMWSVYGAAIETHVGAKLTRQDTVLLGEVLSKLLPPPR